MVHQSIPFRRLGHSDITVSPLGLGCMGMTWAYGPTDEAEALRVLRRYVELGGNFFDTAERVFEKSWFRQSGEHESNRDEID